MSTKLPFICESCGAEGTIEMEEDVTYIEATKIIFENPLCTFCNGNLTAPGGVYERNNNGLLERVGDFNYRDFNCK